MNIKNSIYIILLLLSSCKQFDTETSSDINVTKVIAHRGFSGIAPENTLIAFQKAIDIGADYFELDVHITKDDSIVIIHDNTVDRTSSNDRKGEVVQMTFLELSEIKVGFSKKFNTIFINEKIPTLREALQLAKGKIKVCIEIKVHDIETEVLDIINDLDMKNEVIIFSFYYDVLANIRKLDENIPLLYLIDYANTTTIENAKLIKINAIGVGYNTNPTKKFITKAHENRMEIWKWTVNEEKQMHNLIHKGIDGLITNFPDKALLIRADMHKSALDTE